MLMDDRSQGQQDENAPPGGWRRAAWNLCWRHGLPSPFPHRAETVARIQETVLTDLRAKGASSAGADALAEWGMNHYIRKRTFQTSLAEVDKASDPLRTRPYLLVPDLPDMMMKPNGRGRYRPLIQYCKDWGDRPADRPAMMADPPPPDAIPGIAVSIAAVVHALCDQDEHQTPEWVMRYRSASPHRLWGFRPYDPNSAYDQRVLSNSPPACRYHQTYFTRSFIAGSLWLREPNDQPHPTTSPMK